MSEPRFSDKVERTQKAGLANPDKDVSLYIRSPGSSDREKFGRIVGFGAIHGINLLFVADKLLAISRGTKNDIVAANCP